MDVDGYLRRFIDLEYRLPTLSAKAFCMSLLERFNFETYFQDRTGHINVEDKSNLIETFSELAQRFNLSLRTQEQIFTQLSVVFRTTPPNMQLYPVLLVTLLVIKAVAPDIYIETS